MTEHLVSGCEEREKERRRRKKNDGNGSENDAPDRWNEDTNLTNNTEIFGRINKRAYTR